MAPLFTFAAFAFLFVVAFISIMALLRLVTGSSTRIRRGSDNSDLNTQEDTLAGPGPFASMGAPLRDPDFESGGGSHHSSSDSGGGAHHHHHDSGAGHHHHHHDSGSATNSFDSGSNTNSFDSGSFSSGSFDSGSSSGGGVDSGGGSFDAGATHH